MFFFFCIPQKSTESSKKSSDLEWVLVKYNFEKKSNTTPKKYLKKIGLNIMNLPPDCF